MSSKWVTIHALYKFLLRTGVQSSKNRVVYLRADKFKVIVYWTNNLKLIIFKIPKYKTNYFEVIQIGPKFSRIQVKSS